MTDVKTPEELLNFMSSKINYGYLGKNKKIYHQDDSNFDSDWYEQLERDWFLKNGYEIKTIFEMVNLDYENNYPTHSFLVYKNNDCWYWFENADFNNRGIHKFNTLEELLNYQYNKYIELLKTFNIKDIEIEKIVLTEFDKARKHLSAEEYLEHVINAKELIEK